MRVLIVDDERAWLTAWEGLITARADSNFHSVVKLTDEK